MSDQDSIFDNKEVKEGKSENDNSASPSNNVQDDTLKDLLSGIKNDNGEQKYKTVADALVALRNAQEFIPKLQKEKHDLEAQFNSVQDQAAKVEALEAALLELTSKENKEQQRTTEQSLESPESITKQQLEQILNSREQAKLQERNANTVKETVSRVFGDKAEEVFYGRGKELGMSVAEMNALAASNPKLCLKVLDISGDTAPKQTSFSPSGTKLNSAALPTDKKFSLGKPEKSVMLGASTRDVLREAEESLKTVQALEEAGMSVRDLTNPKTYFQLFG